MDSVTSISRIMPGKKLTYEEFLEWCDEDTLAEWVDGEIVMLSPASEPHQAIFGFLYSILSIFTKIRGLGVICPAPFQMKTGPNLPGREPDIIFVAQEHRDRLKETYLAGPADLVIEIISPESRLRDRGEKFAEYEMGGVREYWIIDQELKRADFYVLDMEGRYQRIIPDIHGAYHSRIISGFWLKLEWLWKEPLPLPLRAVAQICGVEQSLLEAFERALRGER